MPEPSRWPLTDKLVTVLLALSAIAWGCGLDESYTGLGEGALPGDPLRPNPTQVLVDCGCQGGGPDTSGADLGALDVDDLTGTAYRFDSLALTAPLTGMIGDGVNDYFAQQIDDGLMHVLIRVDGDDRSGGSLDLAVGSGEAVEGAYRFTGEPSRLACSLSGRHFETLEPSSLTFPNDLLDPPELPIDFLRLSGWLTADGSSIEDGVLTGALTEEEASQIVILGSDFATFFDNMGIPMDLDTDGDGSNDAWQFVGSFTARRVDVLEDGT